MSRYSIDGTTPGDVMDYVTWKAFLRGYTRAPYGIFDSEAQDYAQYPIATIWGARHALKQWRAKEGKQ